MRGLMACWRLMHLIVHVVRGLFIVMRFGGIDAGVRHARIAKWSQGLLRVLGVTVQVQGQSIAGAKLLVANHVSWLDIAAVHAQLPEARFVSKSDVKNWPLIGRMVDAADTLYIERKSKRDALRVVHQAADALKAGDTVAFFPEGTTGAGPQLLPFHGNLLQAAIATGVPVQPLMLRWHEPDQRFSVAAQFIGETTLVQSLWAILCAKDLAVQMQWLPIQVPAAQTERRVLAAALQEQLSVALAASA